MAKEYLYPSLLKRLTLDKNARDAREYKVWTSEQLSEDVKRCLEKNLFETTNFECVQNLDAYPWVKESVINYGVPDLKGKTLSNVNLIKLEQQIRQAIISFEPRILKKSLKVTIIASENKMNKNAIVIEIKSDVGSQSMPLTFFLKLELDLETGFVNRKS
jgi:type VI secretion system protein ImpF